MAIGEWGMGKSTFSQRLSKATLQEVFHIEKEKYIESGIQYPIKKFLTSYYQKLKNGNCIFDGNSYSAEDKQNDYGFILERLNKSDAIVFFDGEPEQVKADYFKRTQRVESGEEKRLGGSWNSVSDKSSAINRYFERKESLRPRLGAFKNKTITLKTREEINQLMDLIETMKYKTQSKPGGAREKT